MKRGLISIAAMIPLLVLTVESFVELRQAPAESATNEVHERDSQIQKLIEAARQSESSPEAPLADDVKLAQQLAADDLLEAPPPMSAPAASRLHDATEKWRKFDDGREFVLKTKELRCLRPGAAQPPTTETEADQETKEIAAFSGRVSHDQFIADFPPAGKLLDLVAARDAVLKGAIAEFKEQAKTKAAIARVRELFQTERFDECLQSLDQAELKKLTSAELTAEFATLRRRAQFRLQSTKLLAMTPARITDRDAAKDESVRKTYEEFFRTYPEAPTPDEISGYAEVQRRRDLLEINVLAEQLHAAQDVTSLLNAAAKICSSKYADQDLKNRTRLLVRQWLVSDRGLAHKDTPVFLQDGKKEAITKRGQRKLGFFYLPEGGAQTRFWDNKAGFQTHVPALGTERFGEGDLQQLPGTPQYVKWADEFNETSEQLVRRGGTREEWEKFARRCKEIQFELVKYREDYGVKEEPDESCRGWDFRIHEALASEIVTQWSQYEKVQQN